ncbi:MAG: peptidoglycan-binding protein [Paracoccaceae bacterium]|jgi:peptidoglycan hydrolase-like protein with peptidoglycan-binding domain|nr:peptidoglycan-binding protein [Paracoccaceae bacterium]MDP7184092.1 peptidoglycan-binding protein [Paracoccaceae bacterium]
MFRKILSTFIVVMISAAPISAQQSGTWLQVESKQSESEALERIEVYQAIFPLVGGYELKDGRFAVTVGPFSQLESEYLLGQFRRTGIIPADSFVSTSDDFVRQFFPLVNAVANAGSSESPPAEGSQTTAPEPDQSRVLPDETVTEARAGEALLSLDEKKELQVALQWAGFYTSAIDGIFGRGTRGSMRRWQAEQGFEETGVLTTAQRAVLLAGYYAILDGLDMGLVTDAKAGISVEMPRAVVAFDSYTAPFANYPGIEGSNAEIHLISRTGDRNALYALYDVLVALESVPSEGRRKKNRNNIIITGRDDKVVAHIEAYLEGGQIKGFILFWPKEKEKQADRLIRRMATSFRTTNAVLAVSEGTEIQPDQNGSAVLTPRAPSKSLSGVFINSAGTILTSSAIDAACAQIEVQGELAYELAVSAPEIGISVLSPTTPVAPRGYAQMRLAEPEVGTPVLVAGYSFGGVLNAPSLTRGTVSATTGLNGEPYLSRLSLEHFDPDAGGAVLIGSGEMIGLLNSRDDGASRQLPADVSFMTRVNAIQPYLQDALIGHSISLTKTGNDAVDTERHARDIAVSISCWE